MTEKYDVVIIGAGIGGLVCGCYLAKAGLKTLIVEQHYKPGGYCTSFERQGYKFDVGAHYLSSFREGGILSKIFQDLGLFNKITFITNDPTDRFITPNKTVFIRKGDNDTKKELSAHFPKEKGNIENFFKYILKLNTNFLQVVAKTKKITFRDLLNDFFKDNELKEILSIPLISIGLPSSQASALASLVLYREFVFDSGYYPKGGMQVFPDLLLKTFQEYGGKALLSNKVSKIVTKNRKIEGIKINKGEFIASKFVVSNADASETFRNLVDCESKETHIIDKLKTSISAFVVYLGLNKEFDFMQKYYLTGFFSSNKINKCYKNNNLLKKQEIDYLFCICPSFMDRSLAPNKKYIMRIFVGADFVNKEMWNIEKNSLHEKIIFKIDNVIPGLKNHIEVKEISTPSTFNKFTSNKNGAMFGWEAIPEQIDRNIFPSETNIENLYLTGHWVTKGIGQSSVSLVSFCGKNTAKLVLIKNRL